MHTQEGKNDSWQHQKPEEMGTESAPHNVEDARHCHALVLTSVLLSDRVSYTRDWP